MNTQRNSCRTGRALVLTTCGLILGADIAQADYTGLACEEIVPVGWAENGYSGLTTYRVFATFNGVGDDGVLAVYGIQSVPMSVTSSDGLFSNDVLGGLTAPLDLTGAGIWSNQWDTYVTIGTTTSAGDVTSLSPGFATMTNNLASDWQTENATWFVTPDDAQGIAKSGRVLIGQFVVTEGEVVDGTLNLLLRNGTDIIGEPIPPCSTEPLGACCLPDATCQLLTQAECGDIPGAVFLGPGTGCTQRVRMVNHEGDPSGWSHEIVTISSCPEPGDGPECVDGPYHVDSWATGEAFAPGGVNCEDFSAPETCPIAADFFGPGSDPFDGVICFGGVPLGVVTLPGFPDPLDFGNADTLVRRDSDPFDRCGLPPAGPSVVPIVMERLHLASVSPLVVTFNGGQDPEEWDVEVLVDDSVGQPGGSLTALKTHCNGGTFDSTIAVCPRFVFTNVKTQQQEVLDFCADCNPAGIEMTADGVSWIADPGDNLEISNPVCTSFITGVEEVDPTNDCDCDENLVRDVCDIEDDPALDACNQNGVIDGCECPSDFAGVDPKGGSDCQTDIVDLIAVLTQWGACADPPDPCPADIDDDGFVNIVDLMAVLTGWGPC